MSRSRLMVPSVRYGDTTVLVTATASKEAGRVSISFRSQLTSRRGSTPVVRIPGSWQRREGRPPRRRFFSPCELSPIRPLVPQGNAHDVQVVVNAAFPSITSVRLRIAGMIGASAALTVSDIPWNGRRRVSRSGL
jgi:polyribonucleotide nucleotidyltransferase